MNGGTNRAFICVDSCPFAVPFCVRCYLVEKTRATVVEPDWFTAPTLMSYTWLDSNPFIKKGCFLSEVGLPDIGKTIKRMM
jgi:hypothetical protein